LGLGLLVGDDIMGSGFRAFLAEATLQRCTGAGVDSDRSLNECRK